MKKLLSIISILLFGCLSATPALASTLSLSPAVGTFNRSCNFNLDIILDTQGIEAEGVDVWWLNFDPSKFTATSIDIQNKIYSDYPGNSIDNSAGKILISGLASPTQGFNGTGKFATITFAVKEGASTGATQMTFDFDPNDKSKTSDSNVVKKGTAEETLSAVTNGSYTVGTGVCSGVSATPSPAPGGTSFKGGASDSTPSATFIPLKTLPAGGTPEVTAAIAIIGSILTILGVLGLALL